MQTATQHQEREGMQLRGEREIVRFEKVVSFGL
jgi:hypothetical protein